MEAAPPAARKSGDRRPERFALLGTAAWWTLFLVLGSLAATVLYAVLFVWGAIRLVASAQRRGWPEASARAGRGLVLATALSSAALVTYDLIGGGSRKVTEDLMELGLIHLALVGPLFLIAVLLAWLGKKHQPPGRLLYVAYPGSWIVLILLDRLA